MAGTRKTRDTKAAVHGESGAHCDLREKSVTKEYAAPALDKGLDILEALVDAEHGLSMVQLARLLGKGTSEIFRMVVTLQRRGWICVDHGDRYRLSSRMFELAHRNRPMRTLVETALPAMQAVARETGQSCHLSIVERARVVVVAHVDAPGVLSFTVRTGAVVGLLSTASGLVLYAFRSAPERKRLFDEHTLLVGDPLLSRKHLEAIVRDVVAAGYVCSPSEQVAGITNIGCPVFGTGSEVLGALVVPFMEGMGAHRGPSLDEARMILAAAATEVSQSLGFVPPYDPSADDGPRS